MYQHSKICISIDLLMEKLFVQHLWILCMVYKNCFLI